MKLDKRILYILLIGISAYSIFSLYPVSYYKITSYDAAQGYLATQDLDANAPILVESDYDWGKIYLFDTGESKRTVITERKGPFWIAQNGVYSFESNDKLKTIGWVSFPKVTFLAIEISDESVAYVEAGSGVDRVRQDRVDGELMIFSWDHPFSWNDLDAKAYSRDGLLLYEYRYPDSNVYRMSDLRWHPVFE